jgi:hypothetical protein
VSRGRFFCVVPTMISGISFGHITVLNYLRMKNLSRWEIANHVNTSLMESCPTDREERGAGPGGGKRTHSGEFSARDHNNPQGHFREGRSFTQSLWGRR